MRGLWPPQPWHGPGIHEAKSFPSELEIGGSQLGLWSCLLWLVVLMYSELSLSVNWTHALEVITVHWIHEFLVIQNHSFSVDMVCEVMVMSPNCINDVCCYLSALIHKLEATWVNWFLMIWMYEVDVIAVGMCHEVEIIWVGWIYEVWVISFCWIFEVDAFLLLWIKKV